MNYALAKTLLKAAIQDDGTLHNLGAYIAWPSSLGPDFVSLDGQFTIRELEAIVYWVNHRQGYETTP